MMAKRVVLTAVLIVLAALGCKEGNLAQGGISPVEAEFLPEARPPGVTSHYVVLRQSSVDGGRIILDVIVANVDEPVSGIAVKLTYPNSFSKFIACTEGDMNQWGQCHSAEPAVGSGEVFIGRSVIGPNSAPVTGETVVARIEILAFGASSGPIVIEGQNLGGSDTSAVLDVNGDPILMQWFSGILQGT